MPCPTQADSGRRRNFCVFNFPALDRRARAHFVVSFVNIFSVAFLYRRLFHNFALVYDKAKMNFLALGWMHAHT